MTDDDLRELFLGFPGVEERPSYGTPGFRVHRKLLARIHPEEPAVVLRVRDLDERAALVEMDPKAFYVTDHYRGYPYVLAKRTKLDRGKIADVFESAWRAAAPTKLVATFDERR